MLELAWPGRVDGLAIHRSLLKLELFSFDGKPSGVYHRAVLHPPPYADLNGAQIWAGNRGFVRDTLLCVRQELSLRSCVSQALEACSFPTQVCPE